jgi:hypothetical protein
MTKGREPWYRNPFYLGLAGLIVLLAGYLLLATQPAGAVLSALALAAHLAFWAGVVAVLAAGVIWVVDARRPEPPAEDEDAEEGAGADREDWGE